MTFTNSALLVLDDQDAVFSFIPSVSSPITLTIPAGSTGTWTWVVSRAGYSTQLGTFDTTGGGFDTASPTPSVRLQPSGVGMFTGATSPLVDIVFSGANCFIDVGDGSVSGQVVIDAIETALETQAGCTFLAATGGSECTYAGLPAGDFLFMGTGYRFRRRGLTDVNATANVFAISADSQPLDGSNGSVTFFSANLTVEQVAQAVWGDLGVRGSGTDQWVPGTKAHALLTILDDIGLLPAAL